MGVSWKARALAAVREIRRLKKIEHAAWHAMDDAAEFTAEKRVEITHHDWKALRKLLTAEHPEPWKAGA